jgi:hypothetical protein
MKANSRPKPKAEFIPYRQYHEDEITAQPDLTARQATVLMRIHRLDCRGFKGCYIRTKKLAKAMGWSEDQVRGVIAQLKKKGYLVTIGYSYSNIAYRRVHLKYEIDPTIDGTQIEETRADGTKVSRKRKSKEKNPALRLANSMQSPAQNSEQHTQNEFDPPISIATEKTETNKWVEKFMTYPEAEQILKFFRMTTITPATAEAIVRQVNNKKFTPGELLYVSRKSGGLSQHPGDSARVFSSLQDLVNRFSAIRNAVKENRRLYLIEDVNCSITACNEPGVDLFRELKDASDDLSKGFATSFDEFARLPRKSTQLWLAAWYFHKKGEDIKACENWSSLCYQVVRNPQIYAFMKQHLFFDLAELTCITEEEASAIRAHAVEDMNRVKTVLRGTPSLRYLELLDDTLKGSEFFHERVDSFHACPELEYFSDALNNISVSESIAA